VVAEVKKNKNKSNSPNLFGRLLQKFFFVLIQAWGQAVEQERHNN
jgi:hypothetical protein